MIPCVSVHMSLSEDVYLCIFDELPSHTLLSVCMVCKRFHSICRHIASARCALHRRLLLRDQRTIPIRVVDLLRFDIVCLQKYNHCHSCFQPIAGPTLGVFCVDCVDNSKLFRATATGFSRAWSCGHGGPKQYCFLCDMAWCRNCIHRELGCGVCVAALST